MNTDADTLAVLDEALLGTYGLKYRAIRAARRLRGAAEESVALVITAH